MKKVLCDQLLFAPTFLSILLVSIGLLQGSNINSLKHKLETSYFEILINNYKVTNISFLLNNYSTFKVYYYFN